MPEGCRGFELFAFAEAPTCPGHFGVGAGLIKEDQSCLLLAHDGLATFHPFGSCLGDVRPVLLGCQKAFFYS